MPSAEILIHSIRVIAKAREQGIHFSLEQLFHHPTIQGLATELNLDQPEPIEPEPVVLEPIQQFGLLSLEDQARTPAAWRTNQYSERKKGIAS